MNEPKKMINCKKCGVAILHGNFCIDCLSRKEKKPKIPSPPKNGPPKPHKSPIPLPKIHPYIVPPPPVNGPPIFTRDIIRRAMFKKDNPEVIKLFDDVVDDILGRVEEMPDYESRIEFLKYIKKDIKKDRDDD